MLEISLDDNLMYKHTSIKLNTFTLLVGKNGSGKSHILRLISRKLSPDNRFNRNNSNVIFLDERTRLNKHISRYTAQGFSKIPLNPEWSNYNYTQEMKPVIDIVCELFNRKIVIKTVELSAPSVYYEKNNTLIPIGDDGLGISNTVFVFEAIYLMPDNGYLLVDELTMGLHPSIIPKYLTHLKKIADKKQIKIISTTQDLSCLLYFLGNVDDDNFSVYETTDNDGKLWITPIEKDSMTSRLREFLGSISNKEYLDILNELGS